MSLNCESAGRCFQQGKGSRSLLQALRKLREALVHEVVSIHHSRWLSTVWVAPLTGGHLGARQGQGDGIGFKSPTQSPMTPMEISTDIYKTRALQQYFSVYWMDQTMPGCVGDSDGGECVLLLICCHWPTLRPTRHTWESCSGPTLEPSPAQPSQPSPAQPGSCVQKISITSSSRSRRIKTSTWTFITYLLGARTPFIPSFCLKQRWLVSNW